MIRPPKVLVAPPYGELEKQMYCEWLIENGFKPYFLGTECKDIDAPLILCGGADIGKNPIRDSRETEWIRSALENGQPIIGICRGMQLLNYYFGGTVLTLSKELKVYHLKDKFEDDADHSYRLSGFHFVSDIYGNCVSVNSRHHQYCSKIAKNFKITHTSIHWEIIDGNIVEGIEDVKNKIWAVQWHPEREECHNNEYPLNKLKFLINNKK